MRVVGNVTHGSHARRGLDWVRVEITQVPCWLSLVHEVVGFMRDCCASVRMTTMFGVGSHWLWGF